MRRPITDDEWMEWLTDTDPYYGQDRQLAEAFLRLSLRCANAEAVHAATLGCPERVRRPEGIRAIAGGERA